jgi:microcystin-dependent protein
MAEPFLSEIRLFTYSQVPTGDGWAQCNGQLLPIAQNQALFSLLGTTFGGDGRVNFALPDLRARVPIHVGSGHTLGERGGEQAHTVSIAELPQHAHVMQATSATGDTPAPSGALLADSPSQLYAAPGTSGGLTTLSPTSVTSIGGSQAHLNMQPFLTLNFGIALIGIFPSPN